MEDKPIILVVDDSPDNVDVLTGILRSDYQVRVAINGPLAIKLAEKKPQPELILLDIMMPIMDGYQVCKALKSQPQTRHIPVIFVTSKISAQDELRGLECGAVDYISKPITPGVTLQRVKTQLSLYNQQRSLYDKVKEQTEEINRGQLETLSSLGRAAEYKDNETGMHVKRMGYSCYVLAKAFGLSEEESERLRNAAPMHDVGKIGIPDSILLKPGRLTVEEFGVMKQHVDIGVEILGTTSTSMLMQMAIDVAKNHHEKWDGSGYPLGTSGHDIPLVGRISTIADVFDALISERPYKKAWSIEDAVALLKDEKGKHFDPELVDLFLANLPRIIDYKQKFRD